MKTISVLDTAVTSYNLGNQIIMESIYDIIDEFFADDFLYCLPWEGPISKTGLHYMKQSDYVFFGGTNSLSSNMLNYKQMGFRLRDLFSFGDLTLLGVGWWQYQDKPDLYTRKFIHRLLSEKSVHSVRDEYTRLMLCSIGVTNVINTCCPTTWKLTDSHCASIPTKKSRNAVLTLTDYNTSFSMDSELLDILFDSYDNVYYWIQGAGDLSYIKLFDKYKSRIILVPPKLKNYDALLDSVDCDYIGTRLHAGIRAIQKKKRALILAVDNRATEISKDINLNVKPRADVHGIKSFISENYETKLQIPADEINRWKAQFL